MSNLLNELNNKVGGNLINQSSEFLGENESETSAALSRTFPTLIASFIETSATKKGAADLHKMVAKANPNILTKVDDIFTRSPQTINGLMNVGTRDLPIIMGKNQREATNLIAQESGIKKESSSKLMKISTPFLLSVLSKHVEDGNLDAAGLQNLLHGQKSNITSALSTDMIDTLELSSFGWVKKAPVVEEKVVKKKKPVAEKTEKIKTVKKEKVKKKTEKVAAPVVTTNEAAGGGLPGWLKWLVPVLAVLGLIWFLAARGCNPVDNVASTVAATTDKVTETATNVTKGAANAVGNAAGAVKETVGNTLGAVNNAALSALDGIKFSAGSAGSQMMDFIKGGAKGEGKFRFKNLTFASGSANIDGTSGVEVDNLAAILKAYTDVKIAIEGYTDSRGNADKNMTLSQQRADAVKAQLLAQGIDASRITTKGYGVADPVATNDTAEGRAQNRRIEVKIVK